MPQPVMMQSLEECERAGWIAWSVDDGCSTLEVSAPPDADLDDEVLVFCHAGQEMLRLRGWLGTWERRAT